MNIKDREVWVHYAFLDCQKAFDMDGIRREDEEARLSDMEKENLWKRDQRTHVGVKKGYKWSPSGTSTGSAVVLHRY